MSLYKELEAAYKAVRLTDTTHDDVPILQALAAVAKVLEPRLNPEPEDEVCDHLWRPRLNTEMWDCDLCDGVISRYTAVVMYGPGFVKETEKRFGLRACGVKQ